MCGAHTPVFDQVSEGIVDLKESVTLSVGAHVGDWFGSGRQGALDAEGGPLQTSALKSGKEDSHSAAHVRTGHRRSIHQLKACRSRVIHTSSPAFNKGLPVNI